MNIGPNRKTSRKKARTKGRPRASGVYSEDPREEILCAAAKLFSMKGVAGTTIADVATCVGIKQPSVYYHFKDKRHIVDALIDYVVSESVAYAQGVLRSHDSPAEGLLRLMTYHISRLTDSPYDLWFVVVESNRATDGPVASRKAGQWRSAVARLVAEGVKRGDFRPIRRAVAVEIATSMVHAALALAHRGVKVDPDEIAGMYVRLLTAD